MKKIIAATIAGISLLLASCGNKSQWDLIKETQAPGLSDSYFAGYYNEDFAISVGIHGLITYSNDGGQTWTKAQNESVCRYCLDILDENLAWCAGNGNQIRVTKDGGKTWQAVTDCQLGAVHKSIDFIDDKTGWIANEFRIASTNDGGQNWRIIKPPRSLGKILSISIFSENCGYGLTSGGDLIYTDNGGENWKVSKVNELVKAANGGQIYACDFNFYDGDNAEMVASVLNTEGCSVIFLKSRDGGITWETSPVSYPQTSLASDIYFAGKGDFVTITNPDKDMKVYKRKGR